MFYSFSGALLISAAAASAYSGDGPNVFTTGGEHLIQSNFKYEFENGDTWVNTTQETWVKYLPGKFPVGAQSKADSCIMIQSSDPIEYVCYQYAFYNNSLLVI